LYSAGAQAQAEAVAARTERAARYLASVLGFTPRRRMFVLSPADWAAYAGFPHYGMPHFTHDDTIVVGTQPAAFFAGFIALLDEVLEPGQRAVLDATYSADGSQRSLVPFIDLLAIHELGHLFHVQRPFSFPRRWLMELFCNLCLHTFIAETEPEHLPLLTVFPHSMAAVPPNRIPFRSLAAFEQRYVGLDPMNYGWYQCRLHAAAGDIYDRAGVDGLQRLYRTFARGQGTMGDGELAAIVAEQVHPSIAEIMLSWPG